MNVYVGGGTAKTMTAEELDAQWGGILSGSASQFKVTLEDMRLNQDPPLYAVGTALRTMLSIDLLAFTQNLYQYLVSRGLDCMHTPKEDALSQCIRIDTGVPAVVNPSFTWKVVVGVGPTRISTAATEYDAQSHGSVSTIVPAIEETISYMRKPWEDGVLAHCGTCWYSDEDGNHCGMGRVMEVGCTHKLDNQQP